MNEENFIEMNYQEKSIFSKHEILIDSSLKSIQTTEGTARYAKKVLRRFMGDEAEISNVKLKMPGFTARLKAKILKNTPRAKLYITTKF